MFNQVVLENIYIYMFYFYEPFQIIKRVPFDILVVLFLKDTLLTDLTKNVFLLKERQDQIAITLRA